MAKLNGVEIIDMVGGEITRVSYNGTEYERVDGKASEGDLIYVTRNICDTLANSFYEVFQTYKGKCFFDEVGDRCFVKKTPCEVFRKIHAQTAPTLEEVSDKVNAIEQRLSELEDSGRLAIGEYAVITGKGDRGIFKSHRFDIGEVVKVTEHCAKDDRVAATNLDGDEFWWVHNEYLRKATEEEIKKATVPVFEGGDYVKALADGEFRGIVSEEVGKVVYHFKDVVDEYTVYVERIHGHKEYDYFRPQDLAKVEEDCVERVVQFAKAGRELNEFKKGDIVYAEWVNGGGDAGLYEVERGPHGYVSGGNYMLKGGVGTLGDSLTLVSPVESRVDKL